MTMLEKIKEALFALGRLRHCGKHTPAVGSDADIVSEALEAAQQEAEAWEAIEAWLDLDMHRYIRILKTNMGIWWAVLRDRDTGNALHIGINKDRLEVLTDAAAWCRQELAK